ncbi:hypothetical protein D9M72_486120 [compost metagenome]
MSELAEFVVDENAQRLEDAGRRMYLVFCLARRHHLDQARKVAGRLEGLLGPALLDCAGNAARLLLFAEKTEDADEIGDLGTVDDIGGRNARGRHAHVERPLLLEGEAALCLIDLHRGNADIEHDAVQPLGRRIGGKFGELRMNKLQPSTPLGDLLLAGGNRRRVAVERDDVGAGLEDCGAVAARTEGAIEDDLAGRRLERRENLRQEDGNVTNRSAFGFRNTSALFRHHSASPF